MGLWLASLKEVAIFNIGFKSVKGRNVGSATQRLPGICVYVYKLINHHPDLVAACQVLVHPFRLLHF